LPISFIVHRHVVVLVNKTGEKGVN